MDSRQDTGSTQNAPSDRADDGSDSETDRPRRLVLYARNTPRGLLTTSDVPPLPQRIPFALELQHMRGDEESVTLAAAVASNTGQGP